MTTVMSTGHQAVVPGKSGHPGNRGACRSHSSSATSSAGRKWSMASSKLDGLFEGPMKRSGRRCLELSVTATASRSPPFQPTDLPYDDLAYSLQKDIRLIPTKSNVVCTRRCEDVCDPANFPDSKVPQDCDGEHYMIVEEADGRKVKVYNPLDKVFPKQFPGPVSKRMLAEFRQCLQTYPWPFVVDLAASQGTHLATVDGQRIFDMGGLYGSQLLRYNHIDMVSAAVQSKLALAATTKLANPDFLSPQCFDYYKLLKAIQPKVFKNEKDSQVYVVNTGAEAVENCMKYILKRHQEHFKKLGQSAPRSQRFIYFDSGYHGRNVYTMSVTDIRHDEFADDFNALSTENIQVPFPYVDHDAPHEENEARMEKTLHSIEDTLNYYGQEVCGVIAEVLQGAGGNRVALPEFWQRLSRLLQAHHKYLILDEVQTAGGNCGATFASDIIDLPYGPHAIAVAKKFACGVCYLQRPLEDEGILDSTWGGSVADMTKFVEEWKIVEDRQLISQVDRKTEMLVDGLKALQEKYGDAMISNIRGLGLYQGFSTNYKTEICEVALQTESMFLLGSGPQAVRFRPPLDVTDQEIHLCLRKLDNTLARVCQYNCSFSSETSDSAEN